MTDHQKDFFKFQLIIPFISILKMTKYGTANIFDYTSPKSGGRVTYGWRTNKHLHK